MLFGMVYLDKIERIQKKIPAKLKDYQERLKRLNLYSMARRRERELVFFQLPLTHLPCQNLSFVNWV